MERARFWQAWGFSPAFRPLDGSPVVLCPECEGTGTIRSVYEVDEADLEVKAVHLG
jgi:hypothetical protein